MSQRSIRRAQQRREAAELRRGALRARRARLATGAVIGAGALFTPAVAGAATFEVNQTTDAAPDGVCDANCTLRDAIDLSNNNGEDNTITFASTLTGTIRLTEGELVVSSSSPVTIEGPGAGALTISGDADGSDTHNSGDSRIFNRQAGAPLTISGLTLTDGYSGDGGAIFTVGNSRLALTDVAITNSTSTAGGGAISTHGPFTLTRTQLTGNSAGGGGGAIRYTGQGQSGGELIDSTISGNQTNGVGGGIELYSTANNPYNPGPPVNLSVTGSKITGNSADAGGAIDADNKYANVNIDVQASELSGNEATSGPGGAIQAIGKYAPLSISGTTVSGNTASQNGGAVVHAGKYAEVTVDGSKFSGNTAAVGGGLALYSTPIAFFNPRPAKSTIDNTTVSGNKATSGSGGGILVDGLNDGDKLTISRSTISGNEAGSTSGASGGGLEIGNSYFGVNGDFVLSDSTVSGNHADVGGGIGFGGDPSHQFIGPNGSLSIENATIASNSATTAGGGLYLFGYQNGPDTVAPTIPLTSTVVGDNSVGFGKSDLDRADAATSGGFDLSFSLVEDVGDATITESPAGSNITGADPQLGDLADNGGPTLTQLPGASSPLIDKGRAPARLATDQRGANRTVDTDVPNVAGGDGSDIGAVETAQPPPGPGPNPGPPPGPTTPAKVDLRPKAFIKKNALKSTNTALRKASGIAVDDHGVKKVQVALVLKNGGQCRQLRTNSRFTRSVRCHGPNVWLPVKGVAKWTFRLRKQLAPGYYVLYSRAIDKKGHKQISFGTNSRSPFRVR